MAVIKVVYLFYMHSTFFFRAEQDKNSTLCILNDGFRESKETIRVHVADSRSYSASRSLIAAMSAAFVAPW